MLSKTATLAADVFVAVLAFTGCAAEPAPPTSGRMATTGQSLVPVFAAGDSVTPEWAERINADKSELLTAYPVGDEHIVVDWAVPVPEAVRLQVEKNIRAASPDFGRIEPSNGAADASRALAMEALETEAERLGGFDLVAYSCLLSATHDGPYGDPYFERIWVSVGGGPQGPQPSYAEGLAKVQDWANGYKGRTYVVVNHLGCAQ
ncbi:hypothetical protein [Microbacterium aerolatum]|uniref:Lipoprotein n=1 Tax=Microbacterium aerolatum TaxID=153731 RepID=A0A511ACS9_9MICO|nr:hypothetical protein [Microbacterium aerolatum]GEK85183.1 hypothetical protein MAE01_03590 [Microbacterium aerolatum]GGB28869.1 hypothetical protein GCM10007198_19220 [Microbacterium aerolatum]